MFKFNLVLPLVAAAALTCATAVQAAASRDQSAVGTQLAMATVAAGSACQTAGACTSVSSTAANVGATSEPSNYALMAAGLGVIGFIASRRRQQF